jgi:hypothetical protein
MADRYAGDKSGRWGKKTYWHWVSIGRASPNMCSMKMRVPEASYFPISLSLRNGLLV